MNKHQRDQLLVSAWCWGIGCIFLLVEAVWLLGVAVGAWD